MHIYFSGLGGAGIYPNAIMALKLGYKVSGSDLSDSPEKFEKLRSLGADVYVGQDGSQITTAHDKERIDWFVYSSALPMHNPNHPELKFVENRSIRSSKFNVFMNEITKSAGIKQLAISGTHGKTTTTAMMVWCMKELGVDMGYLIGGKPVFGSAADISSSAEWFVFENDEFDRKFLEFHPEATLLSGVTYDHYDIYPTKKDYQDAFRAYVGQAKRAFMSKGDIEALYDGRAPENVSEVGHNIPGIELLGAVNRFDASIVCQTLEKLGLAEESQLVEILNRFPGVERRFEKIQDNLYSDYAHTPEKIAGALGVALESSKEVVVVYEPLHNSRQHRIKSSYKTMFMGVSKLYWVPSFLAREDPDLDILSPVELIANMDNADIATPAELNNALKTNIQECLDSGKLVLCISGGGSGSLDAWVRDNF